MAGLKKLEIIAYEDSIPPGYILLLEEMLGEKDKNKNVTEIRNQINELNEKGKKYGKSNH